MSAWRLDDIALCQRCGRWIKHGQAYAPMIPSLGSWGGFMHAYCPPQLVVTTGTDTKRATS